MTDAPASPLRRVSRWFVRLWRRARGGGSPLQRALSVGIGLFVGCLPVYGLHFPLCVAACVPFGLDLVAAYLAAQISNPWLAPALVTLEARVGSALLGRAPLALDELKLDRFGDVFERALVGSFVVGAGLAFSGALLTLLIARRGGEPRERGVTFERTLERYRSAPRGDRWYVDLKLRSDPVVSELADAGSLGRLIDAGAGRGQIGLFLRDSGQVSELSGFDTDARKIDVARAAAADGERFEVGDLTTFEALEGSADSVLMIDVLHYLSPSDQDAALARVKRWLVPGGRVFVREVDRKPGTFSLFTRLLERVATTFGYNRASGALGFRPVREIVERFEALGFRCHVRDASAGTPFDNSLIVATLETTQTSSNSLQNSSSAAPSRPRSTRFG
jgi:uncharacterized protein (DUF2062 family)/SAM-dependent methyltransferase